MGKLGCQGTFGWGLVGCSGWRRLLEEPEVGLDSKTKLTASKPFSCRALGFFLVGNVSFFTPFGQKGKHTSLFPGRLWEGPRSATGRVAMHLISPRVSVPSQLITTSDFRLLKAKNFLFTHFNVEWSIILFRAPKHYRGKSYVRGAEMSQSLL